MAVRGHPRPGTTDAAHMRSCATGARRYMKRERPGHTLQATAVVHEAFVKLVEMNVSWQDRAHFFAVAARQMRRILVDHAKTRFREKSGGTTTGSLRRFRRARSRPRHRGRYRCAGNRRGTAAPGWKQSPSRGDGGAALFRRPHLPGAVRDPESVRGHRRPGNPARQGLDPAPDSPSTESRTRSLT